MIQLERTRERERIEHAQPYTTQHLYMHMDKRRKQERTIEALINCIVHLLHLSK